YHDRYSNELLRRRVPVGLTSPPAPFLREKEAREPETLSRNILLKGESTIDSRLGGMVEHGKHQARSLRYSRVRLGALESLLSAGAGGRAGTCRRWLVVSLWRDAAQLSRPKCGGHAERAASRHARWQ